MNGFLDSDDPRASLVDLHARLKERIYKVCIQCGLDPDELDVANPPITPVGLNGTEAIRALALVRLCETFVALEQKLGLR